MPTSVADRLRASLPDAAVAAVRALAPAPLAPGVVHDGGRPDDPILPGPGAVAVVCPLDGKVAGTLLLVVGAPLAAAASERSLDLALAHLDAGAGPLEAGERRVLAAEAALAGLTGDGPFLAVPVLGPGGDHVATLAVALDEDAAGAGGEGAGGVRAVGVEAGAVQAGAEGVLAGAEQPGPRPAGTLEFLHDVEMAVSVELGRTRMTVRQLLALAPGAVVELDRAAGSPVDMFVNGRLIARAEVVVVDEEFAVRISEIVGGGQSRRASA